MDDILDIGSNMKMIFDFKSEKATKFEMNDLGILPYYLGIEVIKHKDDVTLMQEKYASKIQEEAGINECNAPQVPVDPNVKLSKGLEEGRINEKEFRRSIGCLRYLLHTRLDLSFSIGVLSRYM